MTIRASLCITGDAVFRERIEPKRHQQQTRAEEWFDSVNDECECPGEQCGTKFMNVLSNIRATPSVHFKDKDIRRKLERQLRKVRRTWSDDSAHWHQNSPTCDVVNMPRELLPLLGRNSNSSPNKWPYCSQSTIDDVKAMKYMRSSHSRPSCSKMSLTLQSRLQQYADSGQGSIAEAIVYNAYYWTGQLAHEPPSGPKSDAAKRRHSNIK
jgi:hypothetical protein